MWQFSLLFLRSVTFSYGLCGSIIFGLGLPTLRPYPNFEAEFYKPWKHDLSQIFKIILRKELPPDPVLFFQGFWVRKAVLWIRIHWIQIRIQYFKWFRIRIRIRIQGFDDQKLKKIQLEKNLSFWSKIAIYLYLGLLKGRPSYRRSLQPKKKTSSTSKYEIY